ncbi:Uma2 family endonuclease [Actinoplanes sp. DH11]|uniref:Uma2 family endonuclease n=1 Tax=Actinoplanes sp. DH11 TaxID=2857011 RepID=UPI001E5A8D69|nr:Uma2 family endonuclease [Actinoplanes sp. DH11]
MTAEPVGDVVWHEDLGKQKRAGYTVEDVLNLPAGAPRVELSDGVLRVVPSPTGGHQKINWRLVGWLDRHSPKGFEPQMAVGVVIDFDSTLEPDALILHSPVDLGHHFFQPEQVVVAIEIVSPGTRRRDRLEKPGLYAAAGVPHYWRIEQDPMHIFAYDLVKGKYDLVADSSEELVLSAPFEIRLPIRDIAP